jgi:hypothetical protein
LAAVALDRRRWNTVVQAIAGIARLGVWRTLKNWGRVWKW